MSSAQKSEVQSWEEEIVPCTHTKDLVQPEPKKLEPSGTFLKFLTIPLVSPACFSPNKVTDTFLHLFL